MCARPAAAWRFRSTTGAASGRRRSHDELRTAASTCRQSQCDSAQGSPPGRRTPSCARDTTYIAPRHCFASHPLRRCPSAAPRDHHRQHQRSRRHGGALLVDRSVVPYVLARACCLAHYLATEGEGAVSFLFGFVNLKAHRMTGAHSHAPSFPCYPPPFFPSKPTARKWPVEFSLRVLCSFLSDPRTHPASKV